MGELVLARLRVRRSPPRFRYCGLPPPGTELERDRRLNPALPQLVNNKSVRSEGVARTGGAWVRGNTLRHDSRPADHRQHDD
jgi:hypothetical protein